MVFWHCEQTLQLGGQHSAQQKLAPSSDPSAQERYELHEPQRTSKIPLNVDLLRYYQRGYRFTGDKLGGPRAK